MEGISEKRLKILLNRAIETSDGGSVRAYIYLLERECKELNPWMPIETAPKDRNILVFNPMTGIYTSKFIDGNWPYFGWNELTGFKIDKDDPAASVHYPHPTHWQELPPKPK
jgi:hypothetical protein